MEYPLESLFRVNLQVVPVDWCPIFPSKTAAQTENFLGLFSMGETDQLGIVLVSPLKGEYRGRFITWGLYQIGHGTQGPGVLSRNMIYSWW